jgi:rubrerythrin
MNPQNVKPTDTGRNRTGIATSPFDSRKSAEGARLAGRGDPSVVLDPVELEEARLAFSREAGPVGTMPPPVGIKGMARAAVDRLKGTTPTVLLDQLGARLAFERTGVRLYEALLVKHEAASLHVGGPDRSELEIIRDDELRHFAMLDEAMRSLGGDPTAVTPSADLQAVASAGIVGVLGDPRTTLTQGLEAILIAELADNDAWETLIDLADSLGHDELVEKFRLALREEQVHLLNVRRWVKNAMRGQAGAEQV